MKMTLMTKKLDDIHIVPVYQLFPVRLRILPAPPACKLF